ncbi:hypothetical protein F511_23817 [Dorcoceras hygrometricum]|uniref:Uncharacterized protein n=1 Tax=Dorcoceras hygrometricum TaxID=472368 RepID=A0A2Z7BP17_9LAMI|nr:hypothetical protein F511_23817 [Dorcoceras hygrometricum]
MAASLIQNALQVNFDSVLRFPHEDDLVAFFVVGLVRDNEIISCVQGKFVGITEEQFADVFGLATEGLTSMDEVPKDFIYDARSVFSATGEPVKTSCKKKEMKVEFRLLNDILAKSVTVKAGSFDAVTHEKEANEPVEKVVKKAAAKRRPAPAVAEPAAKKKRTTVGRDAPTENNLALVPVVQDVEPNSVIPATSPSARRRHAPKRKLVLQESEDEQDEVEVVMERTALEQPTVEETVEDIFAKTAEMEPVETESRIDVSAITNDDAVFSSKVLSNEEGPLVETEKEKEKETEKDATDKGKRYEKQIPEDMMLPSVTAEEPNKIKFGHGISLREVNWYKSSLPQISSDDKGRRPLWRKSNLRRLKAWTSVSDMASKEEQMLAWAETDSLQTAVSRHLYIIAKYREMLFQKLLEARHKNFESGTPTTAIDLQVLDMISEAHSLALTKLVEKMRKHQLEWTRPSCSKLLERADVHSEVIHAQLYPSVKTTTWKQLSQRPFVDAFAPICIFIEPVQDLDSRPPSSAAIRRLWADVCVDLVQFNLFGHLLPVGTYNLCTDIVAACPVVYIDAVPSGLFNAFQHRIQLEGFCDFFVQPVVQNISSSSSSESVESIRPISPDAIPASPSSSASRIHFTDEVPQISQISVPPVVHPSTDFIADIPKISMPTVVVPSADYTESFAQLRASLDKIHLEQMRTQDDVADLKAALSSNITNLEVVFTNISTHQGRIFRNLIHDVQQEVKAQKGALTQDLYDFRKEKQTGIDTLSAQLSEIIAYINRGRDDKKGEESSRGPSDDRSRPGGGSSRPGEGVRVDAQLANFWRMGS